jgi:hypothetical protein
MHARQGKARGRVQRVQARGDFERFAGPVGVAALGQPGCAPRSARRVGAADFGY